MKTILLLGVLLAAALLRAEEPKPLNADETAALRFLDFVTGSMSAADEKNWWDIGGRQFGLFSRRYHIAFAGYAAAALGMRGTDGERKTVGRGKRGTDPCDTVGVIRSRQSKHRMGVDRSRFDEIVRRGLAFVLRLALVLGGLGFASVFAVALLGGGIYLIATGHPTGGYALVGGAVLTGVVVMALVLVAVVEAKVAGTCGRVRLVGLAGRCNA